MNILMALSQREITGAEVYAATLSDQLIERGHNVIIVSDTLTVKTEAKFIPLAFNERSLINRLVHIRKLCQIIKDHDIQIVHANSRASAWVCNIACKLCRIPFLTTTHGRQPVHFSRKLNKGFGLKSICVCENIRTQICNDLGFAQKDTVLLRNPVDAEVFKFVGDQVSDKAACSCTGDASSAVNVVNSDGATLQKCDVNQENGGGVSSFKGRADWSFIRA